MPHAEAAAAHSKTSTRVSTPPLSPRQSTTTVRDPWDSRSTALRQAVTRSRARTSGTRAVKTPTAAEVPWTAAPVLRRSSAAGAATANAVAIRRRLRTEAACVHPRHVRISVTTAVRRATAAAGSSTAAAAIRRTTAAAVGSIAAASTARLPMAARRALPRLAAISDTIAGLPATAVADRSTAENARDPTFAAAPGSINAGAAFPLPIPALFARRRHARSSATRAGLQATVAADSSIAARARRPISAAAVGSTSVAWAPQVRPTAARRPRARRSDIPAVSPATAAAVSSIAVRVRPRNIVAAAGSTSAGAELCRTGRRSALPRPASRSVTLAVSQATAAAVNSIAARARPRSIAAGAGSTSVGAAEVGAAAAAASPRAGSARKRATAAA